MDRHAIKITAESLQNLMIAIGRGENRNDPSYSTLRDDLLSYGEVRSYVPDFVTTCRSGLQFWGLAKAKFAHYHERDQFVWKGFEPLFRFIEAEPSIPSADLIDHTLQTFDKAHVHSAWQKALERQSSDPEAALTSSRTLLETTCKHILDRLGVPYSDAADLPELYSSVAKNLDLSPSQHTEQIFKQILGGCHSVVQGIGSLRNKLGNAHGKGAASFAPAPRHPALAVNLSGAMAVFLVESYEAHKSKTV
jgi:hypothetical protein